MQDYISKFRTERNEIKRNSIESKLLDVISELSKARKKRFEDGRETEEDKALADYHISFTNPSLFEKSKEVMDGKDTDKEGVFDSAEVGKVSQRRITSVSKSKFKGKPFSKKIGNRTYRCLEYQEKFLERIKTIHQIPDKIEIISSSTKQEEKVTLATVVTLPRIALTVYSDLLKTKIAAISPNLVKNPNKKD